MEPIWELVYLLEPSSIALFFTAIAASYASAYRALHYVKEIERNGDLEEIEHNDDLEEASTTLVTSLALMIPIMSSCVLLLMFYSSSSVPQFIIALDAVGSVPALYFCLAPYIDRVRSQFGLPDPYVSWWCCSKSFTRIQSTLLLLCFTLVVAWLVSGHWILNNLVGISICIAFVSKVQFPNMKICVVVLVCMLVYDVFWVFYSERFFGANVMVSVGTQQASNPVHAVANSLSLPGLQLITRKLDLPGKIVFPRIMLGDTPGYAVLGVGDIEIPSMLLALVLCYDNRRGGRDSKRFKYFPYALSGYAVGLFTALAASILTLSPQPALLYLVPCMLGPVIILSWRKKDLADLWSGYATIRIEEEEEAHLTGAS